MLAASPAIRRGVPPSNIAVGLRSISNQESVPCNSFGTSLRREWRGVWGMGLAFGAALALAWAVKISVPLIHAEESTAIAGEVGDAFITLEEVSKHNTRESCWIIVGDRVYDLTGFLAMHPGGDDVILRNAGTDVNNLFNAIHSPNVLKMLSPEQCVGTIDVSTLPSRKADAEELSRIALAREQLPLVSVVNLHDFEAAASKILTGTAWAYYSSAAEDGASFQNNLNAFKRYGFRPRVMRPVGTVDLRSSILGIPTAMPIFVCPAALAGLGHPEGELNLTRAASKAGIIQGISFNASRSIEEIAAARSDNQPLFYQLYVNRNRKESERIVHLIDGLGFRGIMLTVDAPVLGKRERDIRVHLPTKDTESDIGVKAGLSASLDSVFDANLQWSDIAWLKSITKLPIIVKGVQTVEDVELAVENGAAGVLLSNHGGRQLDYAPAAIDVLYELRQRRPDLFEKAEIYIDGGVRRGSDVIKALALGARGVGLGRPFLYSNVYGERGVAKAIRILEEEMANTMRMCGATAISELTSDMVCRYPSSGELL